MTDQRADDDRAEIKRTVERIETVLNQHILEEAKAQAHTDERVKSIQGSVEQIKVETKEQTEKLDKIKDRVNYIYSFSAGVGAVAGLVSAWVVSKFKG